MNHRIKRGLNPNGRLVTVFTSDEPIYLVDGKQVAWSESNLIARLATSRCYQPNDWQRLRAKMLRRNHINN